MLERDDRATTRGPIYLDGRLPNGYAVVCACDGADRSFLVRRLGVSVECPTCGRTVLSADLVVEFYNRAARGGAPTI